MLYHFLKVEHAGLFPTPIAKLAAERSELGYIISKNPPCIRTSELCNQDLNLQTVINNQ